MTLPYNLKVLSFTRFMFKQFSALSPTSLDDSSEGGTKKGKKLPIAHKQKKKKASQLAHMR